jgi:hypothetical protein
MTPLLYFFDLLSAAYAAWVALWTKLILGYAPSYSKAEPKKRQKAVLVTTNTPLSTGGGVKSVSHDLIPKLVSKGYTVFIGQYSTNSNGKTELDQMLYKNNQSGSHGSLMDLIPSGLCHHVILLDGDMSTPSGLDRSLKSLRLRLSSGIQLSGIIHCGEQVLVTPVESATKEDWISILDANTLTPLMITRSCMDLLRESTGRIIFMSSVLGWTSSPLNAPFAVSKMV